MEIDGEPWFVGKDVAMALGFTNSRDAISTHVFEEDKGVDLIDTLGGKQKITIINESGLYALVFGSRLSTAKQFKHWVTSEVLPSIRRHGLYAIDDIIANPDLAIAAFQALKEERQKNNELSHKIEQDKPLVDFANQVSNTSDLIDMNEMAKLLKSEHINIGRNKLFCWLRKHQILMKNNLPYQKYIDGNYFRVKEVTVNTPFGAKVYTKTYVTGKGQIYITEKLKAENVGIA